MKHLFTLISAVLALVAGLMLPLETRAQIEGIAEAEQQYLKVLGNQVAGLDSLLDLGTPAASGPLRAGGCPGNPCAADRSRAMDGGQGQ